ncbi:MAG: asparagine synthase (glutamine-hydrolyzing) [Gammaproteobacteria bacterium]|nr:asparagine synthase (glutamine-hydrolyzing) [Gammaproteobacteria bacterium]NIR85952.1 asparagine synthase (glutamine-hydrolyzing) [Gammaproteobacteria bacterium]NIU06404.1 asparagine synthase (glutamine-hydrolyzing) [Gammaproteobacteria bacterium]NIV53298.1 asparagine synthase (glutamine-hydrolyzing) [Gammaproteobacteria bacterium]NIV76955.1 asparagine synthase (glutamine-hydrolyzing) [Gammaproteobacteria bacterium]
MCGIAGVLNLGSGDGFPAVGAVGRMLDRLRHRGPDGPCTYADAELALGHARLSIIDLAGGRQPIRNEDGSLWVVCNGEIFNYLELRADLEARGHTFYTHSDTEVIPHLYEEHGDDFVQHLNGQFAIALWDVHRRRLVLVRDRVGIAPLFYAQDGGRLYFASEIKGLLAGLGRSATLDLTALDDILTFWAPLGARTTAEGVSQVRPGERIVISRGEIARELYWTWDYARDGEHDDASDEALAEELRALLIDSVRIRLRADVPVGAYLSGGLDSSALAGLISGYTDARLRTFSLGFEDAALDERPYQEAMARRLGGAHSEVVCAPKDIGTGFPDTIWFTESPILRSAPVPMRLLSGLVAENGHRVVLTGEGADEVFGGYDIFKEGKIRQFWSRRRDSRWRALLLRRLYPYLELSQRQGLSYLQNFFGVGLDDPDAPGFAHLPRWTTTARCKEFLAADVKDALRSTAADRLAGELPSAMAGWAPFNRWQYLEAKILMPGYLLSSQGDRMLMANSVEGRYPYLDHRVIELANRLPPKLKMRVLNEKYILKRAVGRDIPSQIERRHKQPYRAPDIPSFMGPDAPEYVTDMLSEQAIRRAGYFDAARVGWLLKKIRSGRAIGYKDNMALLAILSTQVWHHLFAEGGSQRAFRQPSHGGVSITTENRNVHGTENTQIHP